MSDDELIDARTVRRLLNQQGQQQKQVTAGLEYVYNATVGNLESTSRIMHPDLWSKYGDEIKKDIERLKQTKIITADDFDNVLQTVKGRHIDDFIQDGVKKYLENAPPGDVTTGVSAGDSTTRLPENVEIPESYKVALLNAYGTMEAAMQGIREMVRIRREFWGETSLTFEDAIKEIATGTSLVDPMRGRISNENLIPSEEKK